MTDADKIDKALRDTCDGQTMGVPIGPDSSFVVAEIVMAVVDDLLRQTINLRGHRYIDDYELAFGTRSQAEEAQALLEDALAQYELTINPAKTRILELPQPFHEEWSHRLSAFPIRTDRKSQTLSDLIALFSLAAETSKRHAGPLKYALFKSREVEITAENVWQPFQNLVWSAVSAEPTTMATALDLLAEKAQGADLEVDVDGASEVIESLVRTNAPIRNASEVAWGLWAAIALDVKLSREAATAVSMMEDDFVALLALDANERKLFPPGALDSSRWETLIDNAEVLAGPHWLLAYEASVRKWLMSARPYLASDPFFKKLKARKVRFYDTDPQRSPFTGPAGPLPGGLVPDEYI